MTTRYNFRDAPPHIGGIRQTQTVQPPPQVAPQRTAQPAPKLHEVRNVNPDVYHGSFVLRGSLAYAFKVIPAGMLATGGAFCAAGYFLAVPNLTTAAAIGAAIGGGLGFSLAADYQKALNEMFIEHFSETHSVYTEYGTAEREETQPEPEPAPEREVIRPVTKMTDQNGATSARVSRYALTEDLCMFLASRCRVGDRETRDEMWQAAKEFFKEFEVNPMANFHSEIWRPLNSELKSLGWLDGGGRWTLTASDWLTDNGYADFIPA